MTEYLIAFNDEWVPDLTLAELREKSKTAQALVAEMKAAGVFVYTNGGLIPETPVFSVDPSSGEPLFTDGPYIESKEHLGGPGRSSGRPYVGSRRASGRCRVPGCRSTTSRPRYRPAPSAYPLGDAP
jgi:hypothetical protein